MSVFKEEREGRKPRWRYRTVVKLPDGSKERISGAPKVNTKAAAQAAERAHIERVLNPQAQSSQPKAPTLAAFSETFLADYVAIHNKPSEAAQKKRVLAKYLVPALGPKRLDEIAVKDIERLKAYLLRSGRGRKREDGRRSPRTVNLIMGVLGRLLSYAVEIEVIDRAPRIRMLKVARTSVDFLDFDEYERLVVAAQTEPVWHLAILLGGDAGLRRGEIRALRWSDWERRTKQLMVQRSEWKGHVGTTKGWRARTVPNTRRLNAALREARHLRGELVLCDGGGDFLSEKQMRASLPRICRRAGLRSIGWHTLRHTFCAHLAMRGAPAKAIQELAGHADLTTTMRYMHLTPDARDAAIALLENRDRTVTAGLSDPS